MGTDHHLATLAVLREVETWLGRKIGDDEKAKVFKTRLLALVGKQRSAAYDDGYADGEEGSETSDQDEGPIMQAHDYARRGDVREALVHLGRASEPLADIAAVLTRALDGRQP